MGRENCSYASFDVPPVAAQGVSGSPKGEVQPMRWSDVREKYPDQWLIVEALEAHTEGDHRLLDRIAVVETCPDGTTAMQSYHRLHRQHPSREFYFVHTARETLEITERWWMGIRRSHATEAPR
jgi:hypothetical protein